MRIEYFVHISLIQIWLVNVNRRHNMYVFKHDRIIVGEIFHCRVKNHRYIQSAVHIN